MVDVKRVGHSLVEQRLFMLRAFFHEFYHTHGDLFLENQRHFYNSIIEQLDRPNASEWANILDVQRLIFKNIKMYDQPQWYEKYRAAYLRFLRMSDYGRTVFNGVLEAAAEHLDIDTIKHILAPGCGKFFEASDIVNFFGAEKMMAEDIDHEGLDYTAALHNNLNGLEIQCRDASVPPSSGEGPIDPGDYLHFDLALFIHPQICDYDALWSCPLYQQYVDEFHIPLTELKRSAVKRFIPGVWRNIMDNSFARLKENGHGLFIFYEHREQDMALDYFKEQKTINVVAQGKNGHIVDPAFSADMLSHLKDAHYESSNYTVMGAYRAWVLIKKL